MNGSLAKRQILLTKTALRCESDLFELSAFGRAAHGLRSHVIGVGGVVLPEGSAELAELREKGEWNDVRQGKGPQEARPAAEPREGRPAPPASQAASSHAVERGLADALGLGELFDHFPGGSWVGSSPSHAYAAVPVKPFQTLRYRATLIFEVPRRVPPWLGRAKGTNDGAPHVRTWAWWDDGIAVRSFHEYPDRAMCTHRRGDWVMGRDSLLTLAAISTLWIAKALHLQHEGWWPGTHHYLAHVALSRNRPEEYCRCGKPVLYARCCRADDVRRSRRETAQELFEAEAAYRREIAHRGWDWRSPIISGGLRPTLSSGAI